MRSSINMGDNDLLIFGGIAGAIAFFTLGGAAQAAVSSGGSSGGGGGSAGSGSGAGKASLTPGHVNPGQLATYLPSIQRAVSRHPEYAKYNLDESPVVGLLYTESRFDPSAVSPTDAMGIGQYTTIGATQIRYLMDPKKYPDPNYSTRYGDVPGIATKLKAFTKQDALIADVCIEATALHIAWLLNKWNGDIQAALTDYNGGDAPARIVHNAGSQAAALPKLNALPANQRSQSTTYAPDVLAAADKYASGSMTA